MRLDFDSVSLIKTNLGGGGSYLDHVIALAYRVVSCDQLDVRATKVYLPDDPPIRVHLS